MSLVTNSVVFRDVCVCVCACVHVRARCHDKGAMRCMFIFSVKTFWQTP
jgi:hypothetical protein